MARAKKSTVIAHIIGRDDFPQGVSEEERLLARVVRIEGENEVRLVLENLTAPVRHAVDPDSHSIVAVEKKTGYDELHIHFRLTDGGWMYTIYNVVDKTTPLQVGPSFSGHVTYGGDHLNPLLAV